MNSITTNPCTNITAASATINATVVEKDSAIVAYAFLIKYGVTGDPTAVDFDEIVDYTIGTDLPIGDHNFDFINLLPDENYRVRFAITVDGVNFIYSDTVQLKTSSTSFTGTVKIEGVSWTGKIITVGTDKDYANLRDALLAGEQRTIANGIVIIVYESNSMIFSGAENPLEASYDNIYYIVGSSIDVMVEFNKIIKFANKLYLESISFDALNGRDSGLFNSGEDENTAIVKINKVRLKVSGEYTFSFGFYTTYEHPFLQMTNVFLESSGFSLESMNVIYADNMYLDKVSYDVWGYPDAYILGDFALLDIAAEPTDGYGYEYGTAGALIEVTEASEPPSAFIPPPMIF